MREALGRLARHPLPWILLFAAFLRWQSAGYMLGVRDLLSGRFKPDSFHQLRLGMPHVRTLFKSRGAGAVGSLRVFRIER